MSAVYAPAAASPASPWRLPLVALVLVVASLLLLYRDTLVAMVGIWNRSGTFAHCFLVLPIGLWLAWRERERLALLVPKPQAWLLLPLLALAFLWLLGDMAGVNAVTQFALVALLVMSVPAVLGLPVARVLAFPLLFQLFMVPVGEFMMPTFMDWTADFTVFAVRASGIPVYREGLNFVIPSGSWSVVEACSGIRYMIASFMVGSLFAYLNYTSWKRRLLFCLVSLLVPLVANWLRAYMIVMLGHLSGNKLAVGVDHLIYGWLFFGLIIGMMFLIGARWTQPPAAVAPAVPGPAPAAVNAGRLGLLAAAIIGVLALPHGVSWRLEHANVSAGVPAPFALPELPGAPTVPAPVSYEPRFENPRATALRAYQFEGDVVVVHVAYYRHQGYGRKVVSSQNVLVTSEDTAWRRVRGGTAAHAAGGQTHVWRSAELQEGIVSAGVGVITRLDVRQILWVDGQFTAGNTQATALGLMGRLLGRGDDAAGITVFTPGESAAATGPRLDRFLAQHLGAIEAELRAYRAPR